MNAFMTERVKRESEVVQSRSTLCNPLEFSRQEYWSGLSFPSPGDLSDAWIEPGSPTLQADALTSELPEKFITEFYSNKKLGSHSKPFFSHCYTSNKSSDF